MSESTSVQLTQNLVALGKIKAATLITTAFDRSKRREGIKMMETLIAATEPQWILDKTESGPLFWRRRDKEVAVGNKFRVKFLCDVQVKEFSRSEHEFEEIQWPGDMTAPGTMTMGITCMFCIAVSVFLPWYILGSLISSPGASPNNIL